MMGLQDPFRRFLAIYGGLIILAIGLLFFTRQQMNEWFLEQSAQPLLEAEAVLIEQLWDEEGPRNARSIMAEESSSLFQYHYKALISEQKMFSLDAMQPPDELPADMEYIDEDYSYFTYESGQGESLESFIALEIFLPDGENWQPLVIAVNTNYFQEQLLSFNTLIYTIGGLLLLGFVIAWAMIQRIKAHLTAINRTSQSIQHNGVLDTRIPLDNLEGPLADTITQINQMLDAISTAVDQTKQQANNIAHDLRTPLTVVYQKIQQASQQNPDLAELEGLLSRLLQTFNLLLRINRLESNGENPLLEPINLNHLVNDVAELYLPVLEDQQQTLLVEVPKQAEVLGNNDLLFQVLCNLFDNAAKYSPPDSNIHILASQEADTVRLTISDQGGGVDKEPLSKLCEKFYRLDCSRHHTGNGLGLSFAKAAIMRMRGKIEIENSETLGRPGLAISISLPLTTLT
ncbi:sensor histidine kinase KdpD [Photobacterium sp. OFAV2-7]|uniref:sensor histidine kinase n=1 Tax=Photobacterium sp. OFAV2-7 TaxID=2917748 RepID=UPI001EF73A7B|nr:HAMP domain-containing sensor histidine kinase [Photobacterium sp. OFAV2-7]MCG7586885.1 HAMP domain-containing histidine kinase [Photobacterium sp. OFAV2-7]